jgi:thioredoxin-like negative regulator of GroEL
MLKNILQNIEKKYPNVSFIKINVDDDAEIAHFFNISSIPAIFIYNEQKLVSSFKGFRDEEYISNELSKLN